MLRLDILGGIPQAILDIPVDGKVVDIDKENLQKEAEIGKKLKENEDSGVNLHDDIKSLPSIPTLPELTALDPDLVSENLKKARKTRRLN